MDRTVAFDRIAYYFSAAMQETFLFQERESLFDALGQSEARYKLLFQNVTDAIYVSPLSSDGTIGQISEVNDVLCDRLGYARRSSSRCRCATLLLRRMEIST